MDDQTAKPKTNLPASAIEADLGHDFAPEFASAADFERDVVERRSTDRRLRSADESGYTGPERRVSDRRTGLERRRGAGIRREEDRRSAEEGEMTVEQFEFVKAIEAFKRATNTPFPTWIHVLDVVTALGYRNVEAPTLELGDATIANPDYAHLVGEQGDFVKAIEAYKAVNKKRFPTWTEVLEVVFQLGYRKVQARVTLLANVPEGPLHVAA